MARILQSRQAKDGATHPEAIETTGEVFPDGTALELICPDSGAGETALLRWDGRSATVGQQFEVNGRLYRAPELNPTLRALRLPGRVAPCGSTRDLFDDILKLITEYTDIAEVHVRKISFIILGCWLVDRLLVAPFLSVIDPLSVATPQFLRLMSSVCRRPLMLAEVTPAAISSLARLRPTFLLDEPTLTRRAEGFLHATNNSGRFALRNGRVTEVFSAKVICSREPLRDALLVSQALEITLPPTDRSVPFLDGSACERVADEFQSKLLQYRLTNLGRIRTPEIDVSELTAPMQDVARALGTCVADDKDLLISLVQLLHQNDKDVRLDPSIDFGSVILESLLFCCHRNGRSQVLSGELADIVNTIWTKRGEGRQTTPESVGWKLRALGLHTEPIDGAGKGLRLTEAVCARIHSFARAYKVPSLPQTAQKACPHCKASFEKK